MNRAFIAKPKAVSELLSHLRLHKRDDWEPVYIDPETGVKWVGYRLDDNPGDQNPDKLRRNKKNRVREKSSLTRVCTFIGSITKRPNDQFQL